jgi:hypothetical protein
MYSLIVAGSRGLNPTTDQLDRALRKGHGDNWHVEPDFIDQVVSGEAEGVDRAGERWAAAHHIPVKGFPANWKKYGKRAGKIRNIEMADYADGLLAVWDGESPGTSHMIATMVARGKPVVVVVVGQAT